MEHTVTTVDSGEKSNGGWCQKGRVAWCLSPIFEWNGIGPGALILVLLGALLLCFAMVP